MRRHNIKGRWGIVIAFFLGAAIGNFAYDLPTYAFYNAQQSGQLNTPAATAFWYSWSPTLYYLGFAVLGYIFAKTGFLAARQLIIFYIVLLGVAYLLGLQLQHAQDSFWLFTATAGLFLSAGVALGVLGKLER